MCCWGVVVKLVLQWRHKKFDFGPLAPGMCGHRFCSQTKTRGDRNCTACLSLANIFNQSTNKCFGTKLQSEVTGGFTQVRIGNLINQSATSCAISIPLCSKTVLSKNLSKMWSGDGCLNDKSTDQEV